MQRLDRPLLVFDGDCGFCRDWVARWHRSTRHAVDAAPYQEVAGRFPQVPRADFVRAVHLIEIDGSWSSGAAAVFRSLAHARRSRWLWWLYRRVPPFAALSEWIYRLIATHRGELSALRRRLSR